MSAWAELVNSDGSDEHLELCDRVLREVKAEALKSLLRSLEEVRVQRGAPHQPGTHQRYLERQRGEINGLDIAIAAIKRRMK
jgi:hypothetical protein